MTLAGPARFARPFQCDSYICACWNEVRFLSVMPALTRKKQKSPGPGSTMPFSSRQLLVASPEVVMGIDFQCGSYNS